MRSKARGPLETGTPSGDLAEGKGAGTQGHSPSRETNMKVRQAIPVTSELGDISKLAKFDGERFWRRDVRAGEAVWFWGLNYPSSFWLLLAVSMPAPWTLVGCGEGGSGVLGGRHHVWIEGRCKRSSLPVAPSLLRVWLSAPSYSE